MVSLQPNNLHLIIHSTNSIYCQKIWEAPDGVDSPVDGPGYWQDNSGYSWDPIPGMKGLTTEPTVCKWGTDFFVFGLDLDGRIKYNRYLGDTKEWQSKDEAYQLGRDVDKFFSKPGTVAAFPNYLELVVLGRNQYLYQIWYNGETWSEPKQWWTDNLLFKEPPVVTTWGADRLDVFCVDVKGKVLQKCWVNHKGWYPENKYGFRDLSEGLQFANQVQAIARKEGYLDLFAVGLDSQLHHRAFADDKWGNWEVVAEAGSCRGIPELVSFEGSRIDAFVVGTDGSVVHVKYAEDQGWSLVAKDVVGATNFDRPTAVSREPGKIDLVVGYTWNGGVVYRSYSEPQGWNSSGQKHLDGSPLSRVGTAS